MKLNELMKLCTILQTRVLDLEKTKTTQALEIDILKRRVKKLEKKQRLRIHKLKRLYKVGLTSRVDSSKDEQNLGENASKQGRKIDDIDQDEDITLVSDQDDIEMFDVNDLQSEEGFAHKETTKPKAKWIILQDPSESPTTTKTIPKNISEDKGKAIMVEEPVKLKKKDQIKLDEEITLKLQAEFDEEEQRLARDKAQKELEANNALIETYDDVQAKINANYQMAKRLQAEEQQELTDEEKATLFMKLLEKRRKFFTAKRAKEKRNRPLTQAQQKKSCKMFDRDFKRVNTFVDFKTELDKGSSKREGKELTQDSAKKQKVEDDKETAKLNKLMEIIPDEEEVEIVAIPLAVKIRSTTTYAVGGEDVQLHQMMVCTLVMDVILIYEEKDIIMSDSKHSLVTHTSVPSPVKDYSDIGSPEVDGPPSPNYVPGPKEPEQAPLSPDYVPSPKKPEQAPPSPVYLPYVPELVYPEDPKEDEEEDPKEDPTNYPADSTVVGLPAVDHVPSEESGGRGEFSSGAARQNEPTIARDDLYSLVREEIYGFVDRVDVAPGRPMSKELGYGITDTWDELETTIMYGMMEEAQDDRSQLRGRVNLLYRDRSVHRHLAVMAADRRRQGAIKELLAADHKRQGLHTQMIEFQRHHGPVKGLAHPDAPGETDSSS
uniref:Uncharacterized protein n=1 Tax=Tanacetum cinerariifolium TaxID=118510 RepID=A0A6L2NKW6_TANCI|nr:hypothetical protein [Tanacetum cinerariifolium]